MTIQPSSEHPADKPPVDSAPAPVSNQANAAADTPEQAPVEAGPDKVQAEAAPPAADASPAAESAPEQAKAASPAAPDPARSNGVGQAVAVKSPAFLYVDDDVMSREVMSLLLKNVLGYDKVTIFDRNDNFLKRLHALSAVPDVVFLDIQMRPYDGYEMLRMLRDDPVFARCKVIAMTASVMATDVEQLRKAGFDGLIGKPIMRKAFPDLLKQILAGEDVWFVA